MIKTEREKTLIKDVKINYKIDWIEKMKKSLYLNYSKSVNFDEIYEFIEKII